MGLKDANFPCPACQAEDINLRWIDHDVVTADRHERLRIVYRCDVCDQLCVAYFGKPAYLRRIAEYDKGPPEPEPHRRIRVDDEQTQEPSH